MAAKELVEDVLRQIKFDPAHYALFDLWDREARGVVRGCDAVGIQGRKICVKVPSVVHRQEILFHKDGLIQKINQAMGKSVINDIRFELENN